MNEAGIFRFVVLLIGLTGMVGMARAQTTISGQVSDRDGGEDLPFASVYVPGTDFGTTTNTYGFFSITLPDSITATGKVTLACAFIGYDRQVLTVNLAESHSVKFALKASENTLDEAVIEAEKTRQLEELQSTEMSVTRLSIAEIRNLPSIGGETDIIKILQLLPGVQGGNEGTTGLFVRGGDADQNLVLLDEATVYNIGHLFGFFSVFNPDAIKDLTLLKGAFPSNYGGRLSSILDIRQKEGADDKFHVRGGIGLLSSRLTVEGPIKKERASFLISGRRTYIDKVFELAGIVIPYYFYDVNAKVNYRLDDRNRFFYSLYIGNDILAFDESDFEEDTDEEDELGFGFTLGNITNTLRWNHLYSAKLFSNISLISTYFNYDIRGNFVGNNLLIRSNVTDYGVKGDFTWYRNPQETILFGASFIHHVFKPNIVSTAGEISEFLASSQGESLLTQEFAVYGHSDRELNPLWKLNVGLRLSGATVKGRFYFRPEPRVAARYLLNEHDAIKLSYSRMVQYMHRVSSSTVALPTDLWYPITQNIRPQAADQVAAAYNHLFERSHVAVTLEAYYKWMWNLIEYREGANLILNNEFEQELLQGSGDSYGAELLVRRDKGKLNGWISYTLSYSTRDFAELNQGNRFFARYDRRHTGSVVLNYPLGKRWRLSAVWVYQTGSRFTAQVGQYFMPNAALTGVELIPVYTGRNEVQMSPSHRLDFNITLLGREHKKFKSEWSFGCYNVYNRAQPFQVRVVPTDDGLGYQYEQPGLFGRIPSIAYNFHF